ncbi:MAG: (Fe-S)-binding protein [Nitrospirae bacterium]|nr:(Fe-S)-binding protein [Nitrospirota bacterium]
MVKMFLEGVPRWKEEYDSCVRCGACLAVCPTYQSELIESYGPRGRVELAGNLLMGDFKPTSSFIDRLTSCIDCKACVTHCPSGVELDTLFNAAKEKIAFYRGMGILNRWIASGVAWGRPLYPLLKGLDLLRRIFYETIPVESVIGKLLPFVRNGKKRNLPPVARIPFYRQFQKNKRPALAGLPKGRVAFFPGCVINFSETEIGKATVEVLNHYGIEVLIPPVQLCCGIPLISMGERSSAKKIALKNMEMLEEMKVDAVITSCASCAYTFKKEYPKLFPEDEKRVEKFQALVWDVHEFLSQKVDITTGLGEINQSVSFHDPCHLKRGLGISESPREILKAIPGIQFKEMKDADRCCGFGGIFSLKHYDLAMKVAEEKVARIEESQVETVATGCPGCSLHIGDALTQAGNKTVVRHTVQILADSIRSQKAPSGKKANPLDARSREKSEAAEIDFIKMK